MEFQTLTDWLAALLQRSPNELNHKWSDCQVTEEFVAQIAEIKQHGSEHYGRSIVSSETLLNLHRKLRELPCEDALWSSVIPHLENPLPPKVAHDLLDREIACGELEHSRQEDDVQQRMAEGGQEALLTWALDLYCDARHSLEEFETLVKQYPDNDWMLETLMRADASWPDKEIALLAIVELHAKAEHFLYIGKIRKAQRRAQNWRMSRDEFDFLYQMNEPDVLLALAFNPRTPLVYLSEMSEMQHTKFASQIRNAAREKLRRLKAIEKP